MSRGGGSGLRDPSHLREPALVVRADADPDALFDVLLRSLRASGYRHLGGDGRAARLRAGSFLRWQIADSLDIDLIPRFATWGFRALVDLTVVGDDGGARATVHLREVVEHREALAHTSAAVDRGLVELRAVGHVAVIAAVVEGRGEGR